MIRISIKPNVLRDIGVYILIKMIWLGGGGGGGWLQGKIIGCRRKGNWRGKEKGETGEQKWISKVAIVPTKNNYIITLGTNKAQAKVLNPILAHPKHMQPPVFCHRKNCACSKSCIYYRFVQYPVISINKRLHKKKLMVLILDGKSEVSAQVLIKSVNLICL